LSGPIKEFSAAESTIQPGKADSAVPVPSDRKALEVFALSMFFTLNRTHFS